MTFHLLNINNEATPSMLLGHLSTRDGSPLTVLYELKEDRFKSVQAYLDEVLQDVSRILGTPETTVVLVYHRLRYGGLWYKYKPSMEPQDSQSLEFIGLDADDVRAAVPREGVANTLPTIHVRVDSLLKDDNKELVFQELAALWALSKHPNEFKERTVAWALASNGTNPKDGS